MIRNVTTLAIATSLAALPMASALAADAHGEGSGGSGFPQLDVSTYPSQVFWLSIWFLLLLFLMSRIALPRIGEVLDTRRKQREDDLTRAEKLQSEIEEVREGYELALADSHQQAQTLLNDNDAKIATANAAENDNFSSDAKKRLAEAEKSITAAKEEALANLSEMTIEIAINATEKITGGKVTKAEAKKAVTQVMKEA